MKVLCKHCLNSCKKIGRIECDKYEKLDMKKLREEKSKCTDPVRLKELTRILDAMDYGM